MHVQCLRAKYDRAIVVDRQEEKEEAAKLRLPLVHFRRPRFLVFCFTGAFGEDWGAGRIVVA